MLVEEPAEFLMCRMPQVRLKAGQVVEVKSPAIGTLRNRVVAKGKNV